MMYVCLDEIRSRDTRTQIDGDLELSEGGLHVEVSTHQLLFCGFYLFFKSLCLCLFVVGGGSPWPCHLNAEEEDREVREFQEKESTRWFSPSSCYPDSSDETVQRGGIREAVRRACRSHIR